MADILASIGIWPLMGMAAAIFAAAILRAFSGFGFALGALPVLSMFLEPGTSVSLVAMLTLIVSAPVIRQEWAHVSIKPMAVMLALSALGTVGGVYILLLISADIFQLLIGITVIVACALLAQYKPAATLTPGGLKAWIAGLISGLLNGAVAIPGPPVIIYSMAVFAEPAKGRAFLIVFFLFSSIFAITGFASKGFIGAQELILLAFALPAMLAGDKLGNWLFREYGTAAYRRIGLLALFAIGLTGIVGAFF